MYRETVDVKKALTKQIVAATENKYLQVIENSITESIIKTVLEIIQHLLNNYGQVLQTKLKKHDQSVKSTVYTLTEPPGIVFMQMEDLRMLAKAEKSILR